MFDTDRAALPGRFPCEVPTQVAANRAFVFQPCLKRYGATKSTKEADEPANITNTMSIFGELARRDAHDPTRGAVFETGQLELRQLGANRRRGRPWLEWGKSVHQELLEMTGSSETLHQLLASERRHFVSAVRRHFST